MPTPKSATAIHQSKGKPAAPKKVPLKKLKPSRHHFQQEKFGQIDS